MSHFADREKRAKAREQEQERRQELERQELGLQEYTWERTKPRAPKRPKTWELN